MAFPTSAPKQITWIICLVLYVVALEARQPAGPDRPPIIVSTGSVIVDSGGDWTDEGGNKFVEKLKGKSSRTTSPAPVAPPTAPSARSQARRLW